MSSNDQVGRINTGDLRFRLTQLESKNLYLATVSASNFYDDGFSGTTFDRF